MGLTRGLSTGMTRALDGGGASGGAWTPGRLTGLVVNLSSTGLQWSDDLVTPATAAGDRVYKWQNTAGATYGTAADLTTGRLYRTASGGVRGDNSAAVFACGGFGGTTGSLTFATRIRRTGPAAQFSAWFGPSYSGASRMLRGDTVAKVGYYDDVAGYGPSTLYTGLTTDVWTIAVWRRTGSTLQVLAGNGAYDTVTAASSQAISFFLLSPVGGPLTSDMEVSDVIGMTASITDAELTALKTYWGV